MATDPATCCNYTLLQLLQAMSIMLPGGLATGQAQNDDPDLRKRRRYFVPLKRWVYFGKSLVPRIAVCRFDRGKESQQSSDERAESAKQAQRSTGGPRKRSENHGQKPSLIFRGVLR